MWFFLGFEGGADTGYEVSLRRPALKAEKEPHPGPGRNSFYFTLL